ncbi:histone-lysine N-methyltransferase eggless [Sabethes cyaneus]|uniref:histone-lysine N-methyltransferase eggless n=1 Tax=Sabethes cyaneus TaxID=53552 RepID=UPI00237E81EF|nr:histone-lysine N-methyltransferase eggless [Sabethes cyaneus]XP_053694530.1 histone-lysine N-methyltransferase eggless [Sabethes cyaneus]XP_053694531.1 histone-lysine N-methyltransferase eggless [Sabethes cyaneus]
MDLQADSVPVAEVSTSNNDGEVSMPVESMIFEKSGEEVDTIQTSENNESAIVGEENAELPLLTCIGKENEPAAELETENAMEGEVEMMDETQFGDKVTLRKKQKSEIISIDEDDDPESVSESLGLANEDEEPSMTKINEVIDPEPLENSSQLKSSDAKETTVWIDEKPTEKACEETFTSTEEAVDDELDKNADINSEAHKAGNSKESRTPEVEGIGDVPPNDDNAENTELEHNVNPEDLDNPCDDESKTKATGVPNSPDLESPVEDKCVAPSKQEKIDAVSDVKNDSNEIQNEDKVVTLDSAPNAEELLKSKMHESDEGGKTEEFDENEAKLSGKATTSSECNDELSSKIIEMKDDDVIMVENDSNITDSLDSPKIEKHAEEIGTHSTPTEVQSGKREDEQKCEQTKDDGAKVEAADVKCTKELSSDTHKENDDAITKQSDLSITDSSDLSKTGSAPTFTENETDSKQDKEGGDKIETTLEGNKVGQNSSESESINHIDDTTTDKPKESDDDVIMVESDSTSAVTLDSSKIASNSSQAVSSTEKSMSSKCLDESSSDKRKENTPAENDDDVVMVESDPDVSGSTKTENSDKGIATESTSTEPVSEKDVETVDPEGKSKIPELAKGTDESKTDTLTADTKKSQSAEKDDEIKTSSKASEPSSDNKNDAQLEKTIVLDEKLGVFEEKTAQPEEKIPQLITGDSDEDVVMIEDDDPAPVTKIIPKTTLSGTKTVSGGKLNLAAPKRASVPEIKPVKPKTVKPASFDCVNPDCAKSSTETAPAPSFVLNFYNIPKKSKKQRVCLVCYDQVVEKYAEMSNSLVDQQPLLFCKMPQKNELVEISDSSEEEEENVQEESGKPLSSDIISLVETELQDILTSTFEKINLSQQIEWTEQIMKQKIAYNAKLSDEINNELNELQRKVDRIHLNLYSKSRPKYHDLPPCNIYHEVDLMNRNQQTKVQTSQNQLPQPQKAPVPLPVAPKTEEFARPSVVIGQFYFAVKHKLLSNWAECQVVETVSVSDKTLYKVNFLHNQGSGSAPVKVVPAKFLAYRHSFNVKLPLGTRVIARFDAGTTQPSYKLTQASKSSSFYPGIIAESFGKYNRHRYLIFFDDGYAQYVSHGDVRVVCEESKEVWLDIHPHSQEFIRNYLLNYRSQRPMVQVKVGQRIITEWKGKWIYAKVIDIDASLVQLHFPEDNRFEWIYRGSTRLGPLYQEKALSMSKMSNNKFSKFQKRNEPSIEYITIDDDETDQNKIDSKKPPTPQEQALQSYQMQNKALQQQQNLADAATNRSVAKKSTFHRAVSTSQPSAVFMNSSTIYCEDDRPKGKIVYYTAKKHLPPLKYKPHECNPNCLFKITHNLKSYSPLAKPLLSGWERQLCKMKYKKVYVVYRAPCGRRLRNMYELHKYLRMTKATLNVENYDFDPVVHCLAEYVIENHIYHNPDLSDGREFMAVPCVNYFDDTKPPPCVYSTERIPTEGVNLNLDADFLCGCDCEDDCMDKSRCQCWQLTIAGAKFGNPNTSLDNIGYVYKRLQETVVTGIYECNSRCKCNNSCLNRVVQHPLQTKLQVFKTSNRGWGIRCLNDVSKGSFICIYSGHLLTEEAGNMICQMNANKAGDEYFADLDYIETVEQLKEGYETDVVESESELDSDEPDYDAKRDTDASDDDFTTNCNPSNAVVKTRSQVRRDSTKKTEPKFDKKQKKKEDTKNGSDDEREMVSLVPNAEMIITKEDETNTSIKYRSVRKIFGKDEKIYIMDAKKSGNLGRYFNHSCNPNLFVQNVFVDTHDLRFPWVAFFALSNIRAGSELTWNYNYDVGSVEGKVLYCQCGAENCRQRLL